MKNGFESKQTYQILQAGTELQLLEIYMLL